MRTINSYGMNFSITESGRLNCSGLGLVFYDRKTYPIFLSNELDVCMKDVSMDDSGYIVTTDTRDVARDGYVIMGTYSVVGISVAALAVTAYTACLFTRTR